MQSRLVIQPYFGDYEPTYKEYLVIMFFKGQKRFRSFSQDHKGPFFKINLIFMNYCWLIVHSSCAVCTPTQVLWTKKISQNFGFVGKIVNKNIYT